jgi:hypothetical protein
VSHLSGAPTSALLVSPQGLAMDSPGDLLIANTGGMQVDKITPSGTIITIAGSGSSGTGADNVPATSSALDNPAASRRGQRRGYLYC